MNNKINFKMNIFAQVSVFVVIGFLIVIAGAFIAYSGRDYVRNINVFSKDAGTVKYFVEDCIKQTGEQGIYQIGNTGGYVIAPEISFARDNLSENYIAYYLYKEENLMPSKKEIENQLSLYMDNFIYFCINDFSEFTDFDINGGNFETLTKIEEDRVIFKVYYPLNITKNNKTYFYKDFKEEIPVRLGYVYDSVSEIMNEQMKNTEAVCISCLQETTESKNIFINMFEGGNQNIIFLIRDEKSKINKRDFQFYFANNYEEM